jgi:hypothetical protein
MITAAVLRRREWHCVIPGRGFYAAMPWHTASRLRMKVTACHA